MTRRGPADRDRRDAVVRRGRSLPWLALACLLSIAGFASPSSASEDDLRAAREARAGGRLAEAIDLFRAALADDPGDVTVLGELAQVLSWEGRYDEAIAAYRDALARAPDAGESAQADPLRLGLARTCSWAKRFDESLAEYATYLAEHPGDTAIELEAARVRSWSGDYDAAIDEYRAYLQTHPDDREIRRELAKVLSWARRYDESIEEFRTLLAADPDDRETRLGLARALGWSGAHDQAIAEYRELLERDPADVEAQVGLARTLAWSGDLDAASDRYDAILADRPGNAQALLGKAQIAYWQGEERESEQLLARAESASPGDPDIEAFRRELRKEQRPFLDSSYRRFQDNDGNDYKNFRVSLAWRPRMDLSVMPYYERTKTFNGAFQPNSCGAPQDPDQQGIVDTLGAQVGFALPKGIGLLASAGVARVAPSAGGSHTEWVGSAVAFGPISSAWRWRGTIERRVFDATRGIIDCGINYGGLSGGVDGTWRKWRFGAGAGFTTFSDGNDRAHLDLSATRPLQIARDQRVELGWRFRAMGYSENLLNGYFDPQAFVSNLLVANFRGKLFHPRVDYAVLLTLGLQSFREDENTVIVDGVPVTLPAEDQTNQTVTGWELRIGWNITDRARLEGWIGETDYALSSATGFQSETHGLLFRYRF